jgi:nitrogen fixation protein FixH
MTLKESITSKKFWFAMFAILIGFGFAIVAAVKLTEMKSMFETFTGLIEFVTATYLTGNVANKWVVGKTLATKAAPEETEPKAK